MFLNIAGGKQLSTQADFYYHLRKAKSKETLEFMLDAIFKRNGFEEAPKYRSAAIKRMESSQFLKAHAELLKAAELRQQELDGVQVRLPGWDL